MLCLSSCATVENPQPPGAMSGPTLIKPPVGIEHVVLKGETLWLIAKMYHTDLEDIVTANKISDSTNIAPGQKIIIPKTSTLSNIPETNFASKEDADFIWPTKGKIITQFRQICDGVSNKGIDMLTEPYQDVRASSSGRVAFVGNLAGYGSTVIIEHPEGLSTVYCGNSSVNVRVGDEVKKGMVVAKTGNSPRKGCGSFHFEIRKRSKPQNPLYYLN